MKRSERSIKYIHSKYLLKQADKNPAVKGRASLTHELIASYGLTHYMEVVEPIICNASDIRGYHTRDYVINFGPAKVCQNNTNRLQTNQEDDSSSSEHSENSGDDDDDDDNCCISEKYGLGFDCPLWNGIKDYVCTVAGATMTACDILCKNAMKYKEENKSKNRAEIVINWTGGWHHAHREKAAGFCYVNDIVLGILILSKKFQRILYVDLDIHHGDGVEYAFRNTKNVFTLSFHKYEAGYYPGTGAATDCGYGEAKGYAVNFPYSSGITGRNFVKYFRRIATHIFSGYQPQVCVLQCGADVIVGDPLGGTNLLPQDLIECCAVVMEQNLPTVLLGGGGYHFPNASRYWTLLTAFLCDQQLDLDIPDNNANFLKYGPDYSLEISKNLTLKDMNTEQSLEATANIIEDNLRKFNVCTIQDKIIRR